MSDSLTATKVDINQCPSHQSILLTQGRIHENFKKKYWELAELENEVFLRWPFWFFFLLHLCENSSPFTWGIIFFCTIDGFSRILEKKLSALLCTRLYYKKLKSLRTYSKKVPSQGTIFQIVFAFYGLSELPAHQFDTLLNHFFFLFNILQLLKNRLSRNNLL